MEFLLLFPNPLLCSPALLLLFAAHLMEVRKIILAGRKNELLLEIKCRKATATETINEWQ